MIKYKLICNECSHTFDSWFPSSIEYEKLKKKNYLNCYKCNSEKVEKTLMAPRLLNKRSEMKSEIDKNKFNNIKQKLKDYNKFIKKNFDYVGENFAFEARSIHYEKNKKKDNKGIYGSASNNDLKELQEEGIDVQTIPWIEDENN